MTDEPPGTDRGQEPDYADDATASVVRIDRREDLASVCGRVDTAPTYAVIIHAPEGNRQLTSELGMRRLKRHAEESGKMVAVATGSVSLAARARQVGLPVARRSDQVRWDSGGRRVFSFGSRSIVAPAVGRYLQMAFIIAVVLLFIATVLTMGPSAEITIAPPTEALSQTVVITASESQDEVNFETLAVPATRIESRQQLTLALATTGTVSVPSTNAKAALTITNPGAAEVAVPRGTVLLAGSEFLPFELDADVRVAAGQSAQATATAADPGAAGNVVARAIGGWLEPRFRTLTVTNAAPAAGGADEARRGVTADDLAAIRKLAADLVQSESLKRTILDARPHDAVFLRTAETTVEAGEPSATAGTAADILLMKVDVVITALAIEASVLEAVARHVLSPGTGLGEFIPGSVTAIETGAREINIEESTVTTEIAVRGEFARDVTKARVVDAVKGKSESGAKSTLASRYGIQDAKVDLSPGWAPWVPRFGFRIDVNFESRAVPSPASGPSANGPTSTPAPTATPRP